MSLNDMILVLFGGALVAIGVLFGAIADRIRSVRQVRERRESPRETLKGAISTVEIREPGEKRRAFSEALGGAVSTVGHDAIVRDVVSALVNLGLTKKDALEATKACAGSERGTIESWVRAALKRNARAEEARS